MVQPLKKSRAQFAASEWPADGLAPSSGQAWIPYTCLYAFNPSVE